MISFPLSGFCWLSRTSPHDPHFLIRHIKDTVRVLTTMKLVILFLVAHSVLGADNDSGDIRVGDVMLKRKLYEYLYQNSTTTSTHRSRRAATALNESLFNVYKDPGGRWVIPYLFSKNTTKYGNTTAIHEGMRTLESEACFKFVRRTDEKNYVEFIDTIDGGCWAYLGRLHPIWQPNQIHLSRNGCYTKGIVIHELMHAFGFRHENLRPDRDDYIKVFFNRIIPEERVAFRKATKEVVDSRGFEYDFDSIMHADSKASSIDGRYTMKKRNGDIIPSGLKTKLSKGDIEQLRYVYGCKVPEKCKNIYEKDNCNSRLEKGQCNEFPMNMKKNCGRTCGLCRCVDDKECFKRMKAGECYAAGTIGTMRRECPLACRYCGKACVDVKKSCVKYLRDDGKCAGKRPYLAENCRKTCGFCIESNVWSPPEKP